MLVASGPIFEVAFENQILRCRVWRDNSVDEATGAECAESMSKTLLSYARGEEPGCSGILFDVTAGPPAFGPRTEASLRSLLQECARHRCPVCVLVGQAMQELQYGRLLREIGLPILHCTRKETAALQFLAEHARD